MKKNIFDFGLWFGKAVVKTYQIPEIINYLNDKKSVEYHVKNTLKLLTVSDDSDELVDVDKDSRQHLVEAYLESFDYETIKYINNHIVYQYAVLEKILEDCVYFILVNNTKLLKRIETLNSDFKVNLNIHYLCLLSFYKWPN